MRLSSRLRLFAISQLLTLPLAVTASAQDRLFIGSGELGAFGHFGDRLGPAPPPVYGQMVAGGRYVSTLTGAYDTSTGAFVAAAGGTVIAVDPRRARLFVHDLAIVSVFDLDRRVSTPLLPSAGLLTFAPSPARAQLAADANELFVWQVTAAFTEEIAVVDLASAVVVRRFPIATVLGSFSDWRVTADGRRLYVADGAAIRLLDATTGGELASFPAGAGRIIDDRLNRRIYLLAASLWAFDDTLAPLARLDPHAPCAPTVAYSHHTGRLYLVESTSEGNLKDGISYRFFLSAFDTANGRRVATREITAAAGLAGAPRGGAIDCSRSLPIAILTAPGAPRDLSATVSGRAVTLTWTNVSDAAQFVLDVGAAPGRTDATFGVGSASSATFLTVPPGTYYLRVRGTNAFGVSRASNEVALVVR